jgi:outer membrane immunogenic protein
MTDTTNPFVAPPDRLERVSERIPPNFGPSGFYAGLNTGYTLDASPRVSSTGRVVSSAADARFFSNGAPVSAANITGSVPALGNSVIGGGQVGYNLTNDVWLLGTEADIQGAGQSAFSSSSRMANATVAGVTETATYGETSSSTFVDQQWAGAMLVAPKTSGSVGIINKLMIGWSGGGGIEWMFAPNLTAKAEYLLYDLGSVAYASSASTTSIFGKSNSATPMTSARYTGGLARLGLNYYFNP